MKTPKFNNLKTRKVRCEKRTIYNNIEISKANNSNKLITNCFCCKTRKWLDLNYEMGIEIILTLGLATGSG